MIDKAINHAVLGGQRTKEELTLSPPHPSYKHAVGGRGVGGGAGSGDCLIAIIMQEAP